MQSFPKIRSVVQLYELIPEEQRIIVDVLRQIAMETLPDYCKEKISYNVPLFRGRKTLFLIWPSAVPRGGIKEGVMLAFWYGYRLTDEDNYLEHGTNKCIFYRIFKHADEIDVDAVIKLFREAVRIDAIK